MNAAMMHSGERLERRSFELRGSRRANGVTLSLTTGPDTIRCWNLITGNMSLYRCFAALTARRPLGMTALSGEDPPRCGAITFQSLASCFRMRSTCNGRDYAGKIGGHSFG